MKDTLSPRWSALHLTVLKDLPETCQILVSAGANVNTTTISGNTPLLIAACHKKLEISRILISGGANPNIMNWIGMTPLHWAVSSNDLEIVRLLISAGAGLNIQNIKGETPLHHCDVTIRQWWGTSINRFYGWDHLEHKAIVDLLTRVPLRKHYSYTYLS